MKPSILVILFFATFFSCSTYYKTKPLDYPRPFQFVLIDSLPGSKDDLYVRANEWMAKAFVSSKDVIQMQDKQAGKIVGKAVIMVHTPSHTDEEVGYTITIDAKDGKYRCILSNFIHKSTITGDHSVLPGYGRIDQESMYAYNKVNITGMWNSIKNAVMKRSLIYLDELKTAMHSKEGKF